MGWIWVLVRFGLGLALVTGYWFLVTGQVLRHLEAGQGCAGCSEEDLLAPEQVVSVFTHLGYRRDAAGMQ